MTAEPEEQKQPHHFTFPIAMDKVCDVATSSPRLVYCLFLISMSTQKICTWTFIAASLTTGGNNPEAWTYEWMNTLWSVHTMECLLFSHRVPTHMQHDEPWKHAKWKEVWHKTSLVAWFHLYEMSKTGKSTRQKIDLWISRSRGGGS